MNVINKYDIEECKLKDNLFRVGDLVNMDGPMLVLFRHNKTGNLYLFDWVDNNEILNRWLIYRVAKEDLIAFVKKRISYKSLFDRNQIDTYFSDIESGNFHQYHIYRVKEVPDFYKPDKDILFDPSDSKNLDKILKELNIDTVLNEKEIKQYNFIFRKRVLVVFETQKSYIHATWPVTPNKFGNITHHLEAHQPNVSKSNSISRKKSMVLQ